MFDNLVERRARSRVTRKIQHDDTDCTIFSAIEEIVAKRERISARSDEGHRVVAEKHKLFPDTSFERKTVSV